MLQFLTESITRIIEFFKTVWDFVINFFKEIVYIIQLLLSVVESLPSYFVWLPATVTALLVTGLSIIVIYKVIGRD